MKKMMKIVPILVVGALAITLCANQTSRTELRRIYEYYCSPACHTGGDFREHIPALKHYSADCESVMEIGIRDMVSSWGVLQGLAENGKSQHVYIGVDLNYPPADILATALRLAQDNGIDFKFIKDNDMNIRVEDMEPVDMLFIDSLHTYCHLTYELEKFSPKVRKYISMHDTSEPWGDLDDNTYHGDYSEYPAHYNRTKRGLWVAVEDFLKRHPEWTLLERRLNCHGFTVLKRISN